MLTKKREAGGGCKRQLRKVTENAQSMHKGAAGDIITIAELASIACPWTVFMSAASFRITMMERKNKKEWKSELRHGRFQQISDVFRAWQRSSSRLNDPGGPWRACDRPEKRRRGEAAKKPHASTCRLFTAAQLAIPQISVRFRTRLACKSYVLLSEPLVGAVLMSPLRLVTWLGLEEN